MRLLVLGGTAFLGRTVAEIALAAGHEVTCAARGVSGRVPEGAGFVPVDRDLPDGLAALAGHRFDALVDVATRPSHVRRAVEAFAGRVAHAAFVSTGSVYADQATPGQRASSAPVVPAAPPEVDDPSADDHAAYGPCKVAAEEAVRAGFGKDRTFVCRAGLIIGPGDTSGRFGYWVSRLARGGNVLAPGEPDEPVQYVDVRDLAAWLVLAAEARLTGVFDGIGAPVPREHFLTHVAAGVGAPVAFHWVDQDFLLEQGVRPWMGERSLPMWLPLPRYAGFLSRDVSASLAAGLHTRDVAHTARDTLAWLGSSPVLDEPAPGLPESEETALLTAWRTETA